MSLFFLRDEHQIAIGKWKIRYADLLFLLMFIIITGFFVWNAPYGITESDESLYQFFCYRLMKGDHLFADDWTPTNQIAVFVYLPFRFFAFLLGGTEGILLALRYLYIGIKMVFFAYIYTKLREYGTWAVLSGCLYVGTDLLGIKTTSYYSVCLNAVFLTGMILFVNQRKSTASYIAAGFLFSCAVIAEPPVALLWVFYSVLVLLCLVFKKRGKQILSEYDFILNTKVWRYLFLGVCCAIVMLLFLCVFFFTGTNLKAIGQGVSEILHYFHSTNAGAWTQQWLDSRRNQLKIYMWLLHPACIAAFLSLFVVAVLFNRYTKKGQKVFFVLFFALYVFVAIRLLCVPMTELPEASGESACHPMLLSLLAVVAYTFSKEKNRKQFAFLLFSFAVSVLTDFFSGCTFGSMLLAGSVPTVLLLRKYFSEQGVFLWLRSFDMNRTHTIRASLPIKRRIMKRRWKQATQKRYCAVLLVVLCFVPSYEIAHYIYMGHFHETERCFCRSDAPIDTRIQTGISKGIITTKEIAEQYEKSAQDAARIRQICQNGLISTDYDPTIYLNAGTFVYTSHLRLLKNDWNAEESWWIAHPNKKPDTAYIPFSSLSYVVDDPMMKENLTYLTSVADASVMKGERGYIVRLTNWCLPEESQQEE